MPTFRNRRSAPVSARPPSAPPGSACVPGSPRPGALRRHLRPRLSGGGHPGTGKTTFAPDRRGAGPGRQPRATPRRGRTDPAPQAPRWSRALHSYSVCTSTRTGRPATGSCPAIMHARIRDHLPAGRHLVPGAGRAGAQAFVVFDEIHHAGDDRAWGVGAGDASAERPPPVAGHAVSLRHLRHPVRRLPPRRGPRRLRSTATARRWPTIGSCGRCTSRASTGSWVGRPPTARAASATFDDELAREQANQRLRTALSLEGQWLPAVLDQAQSAWSSCATATTRGGRLVIAMDQARGTSPGVP